MCGGGGEGDVCVCVCGGGGGGGGHTVKTHYLCYKVRALHSSAIVTTVDGDHVVEHHTQDLGYYGVDVDRTSSTGCTKVAGRTTRHSVIVMGSRMTRLNRSSF